MMKYWVCVVSKKHGMIGVEKGIIQVCHGKAAPLKRMKKQDKILLYSHNLLFQPSSEEKKNNAYQKFIAVGEIITGEAYQFKMSETFIPFRMDVKYYPCKEIEIKPLITNLSFIKNKINWGVLFKFGHFEIPQQDFQLIYNLMCF